MENIIELIREELKRIADIKIKSAQEKFFKEPVRFLGIRNHDVHKISSFYFRKLTDKSKNTVFCLCEILWQSDFMEEKFIACDWSYRVKKEYIPGDFDIFERWVNNYVNNWATCDTLCNHSVGTLIEKYPELIQCLKKWALSENRWMRRAAAVSLIIPGRKGLFIKDIFEIAEILLLDTDDMVQKGYGWMLKAASEFHLKDVYEFVITRKSTMPRTAYRYAIEKMPSEMKKVAMKKY